MTAGDGTRRTWFQRRIGNDSEEIIGTVFALIGVVVAAGVGVALLVMVVQALADAFGG